MQALLVYASVLMPLFVRLSYHAASPNTRSVLQGPLLPVLALILVSVDALVVGSGVALFIPTLIALSYTLGGLSRKSATFTMPNLPCPARAIYGANITAVFMSFFLIATMMQDDVYVNQSYWWEGYVSAQITSVIKPAAAAMGNVVPLLVLPVLFLGYAGVQRPKTEAQATEHLEEYLAEEVAYGFERTWAYYRQSGLLSFMAYVWGISRLYRGVIADGKMPTAQAQYLLLVTLSLLITLVTIAIVEGQTTPKDELHDEALKAIQRAPAGNPGIEDYVGVLVVLGLVAGPGLSAMLWFAHDEEIKGWKGRRAWRLNTAKKSAK